MDELVGFFDPNSKFVQATPPPKNGLTVADLSTNFDACALFEYVVKKHTKYFGMELLITSRIGLTAAMKGCGTKRATWISGPDIK